MKGRSFTRRLSYALNGLRIAFRSESSFRIQVLGALAAVVLLLLTRPGPTWTALVILTVAAVLSVELINSALEQIMDRLHPEQHPAIAKAKDCAAGAVLVLSLASLGVAAALLWDRYGH